MSNLIEIVTHVLQAQAATVQTCSGEGGICPATAFNPVAAAFATQGYFMQADMLYFLVGTGFGIWAPFIYLLAAAGGIISLALGAPPKMYVWFFIGPGIYHWLVETRSPAHGVQWQVGRVVQDQRQVWRLAHVGINNSNLVARMAGDIDGLARDERYELEGDVKQTSWCKPTASPVYVSNFFLWFDQLISYTVQLLVEMTGVTRTTAEQVGSGGDAGSLPLPTSAGAATAADSNRWYLLSDKKWVLLDTITSARLNSSALRDAFQTFLSSECGDALSSTIDNTNFVNAANSSSGNLPCTVMLHTNTSALRGDAVSCYGDNPTFITDKYKLVWDAMRTLLVPIPEALRKTFQDSGNGSFVAFLNGQGGDEAGGSTGITGSQLASFYQNADYAECHQNFYTIMQGFRWEAGQIYSQLIQGGPIGVAPDLLLYNLFYGWGVRKELAGELVPTEEIAEWTRGLILSHLLRNELAIAPRLADKKFSNQLNLDNFSQNYTAQTGSKAKYGEVYAWARMVPYIQGVLLYLLAMGYPFACIMIVMPGWHKTLFTWMSFWVWVKLWDAGFAVVTVLERSIWSMLGNSTKLNYTSPLVYQMKNWGATTFPEATTCPPSAANAECFADMKLSLSCSVIQPFYTTAGAGDVWWHSAALFDRALMMASSLDLDVANGYYIYLMSALYFAVPAATGQLVLGAKAGVAGMVNGLMQGAQQDAGRGASSGFLGNFRGQAAAGAAAMRQEAHAKGLARGGLAEKAFDQSNASLNAGFQAGLQDATGRQQGLKSSALGIGQQIMGGRLDQAGAETKASYAKEATVGSDADPAGFRNPASQVPAPRSVQKAVSDVVRHAKGDNPQSQGLPKTADGSDQNGGASTGESNASGNFVANAAQAYKNWWGDPRNVAGQAFAEVGYATAKADMADHFGRQNLALTAGQSARALDSFAESSGREAYGIGERRYGAAAEFGAQTSVFNASVGLSDSAAGYIGSLGGDASVVSPTAKPTEVTGMAMSGRLGMSAQSAATWAMGDFQASRQAAVEKLQSNFGANFVYGGLASAIDSPNYSAKSFKGLSDYHGNKFVGADLPSDQKPEMFKDKK